MPVIVGVGAVLTSPAHPGKIVVVTEAEANAAIGKQAGMIGLPAGKVERDESVQEAIIREILEETGIVATVASLIGYYLIDGAVGIAFHCVATTADLAPRDGAITAASWMTPEQFLSSMVSSRPAHAVVLADYLAGQSYPLESIKDCRVGA